MSIETARIALQSPQVPPAVLVDIANNHPQLHTAIANHASAYPELLQWLANTSPNEQARLAAANRLASAGSEPVPGGQPQGPVAAEGAAGQLVEDKSATPTTGSSGGSKCKIWLIAAACIVVVVVGALVFTWLRPSGPAALGGVTLNRMQVTGEPVVVDLPEEFLVTGADPIKPYVQLTDDGPGGTPLHGDEPDSADVLLLAAVYRLDGEELVRQTEFEDALSAELTGEGERFCFTSVYNGVVTASCISDEAPAIGFFYDLQSGQHSTLRDPHLRYVTSLDNGQRIGFLSETAPVDSGYEDDHLGPIYGTVAVYGKGDTPIWESPDIVLAASGSYSIFSFIIAHTAGPYVFIPQQRDADSFDFARTNVVDTEGKEVFEMAGGSGAQAASIWPGEGSLRWSMSDRVEGYVASAVGSADLKTAPAHESVSALTDALQDYGTEEGRHPFNSLLPSMLFRPQILASFADIEAALANLEQLESWRISASDDLPDTIAQQILTDGSVLTASPDPDGGVSGFIDRLNYTVDLPEAFAGVPDKCGYGSVIVDSGKTLLCTVFSADGDEDTLKAYRADAPSPVFTQQISRWFYSWTRVGNDWVLITRDALILMK